MCPSDHLGAVDSDYRARFLEFVQDEGIKADLLVASGDISDSARPAEIDLATQILREFTTAITGDANRLVIIPGNHDVDWVPLQGDGDDPTGFRKAQRFAPANGRGWVFRDALARGVGDLFSGNFFCCWRIPHILVVGLNSASHDGPDQLLHHGQALQEHLQALDKHLRQIEVAQSDLRLLLIHHHPIQYSDPIADRPDFSILTNAENLLSLLARHRFDLLIHGHKHFPRFCTQQINASHPLAVLGSGSFSALLSNAYAGAVANQFHLVTIDGRDPGTGRIFGTLQNWAFSKTTSWRPSSVNDGIDHQIGFGAMVDPDHLRQRVKAIVDSQIAKAKFVKYSFLQLKVPELQYMPHDLRIELLRAVAKDCGLELHNEPPDCMFLDTE